MTFNDTWCMQPAEDHLKRKFKSSMPNQAWVSDTIFIPTRQGWLYLAVMVALYSRQVIGWSMSEKNDRHLVANALSIAIVGKNKIRDVIVHSDQGSTYA